MSVEGEMNEMFERVAAALEGAEVGYSLRLTKLVDGISTYTLAYDDGTPPLEFDDNSEAYAHIAAKKRVKAARLALEAMRLPTDKMIEAAGGPHIDLERADDPSYEPQLVWEVMIDAVLSAVRE